MENGTEYDPRKREKTTYEKWLETELEAIRSVGAEMAETPEKAQAFLQRAGILDDNGNLAEKYRDQ